MKNYKYVKTPTVYQMEATECGAAALAMVLGYFGRFIPLEKMRLECGVSRDGSNAKNILRAAKKYGLEAHGYRKDISGLMEIKVPSIIHWNFNHFVVYEGRKGKHYIINDPAEGRRRLTYKELDEGFTGVVLTFSKTENFIREKRKNDFHVVILDMLNSQREAVSALVVMGLFLVIPGLLIPVFSKVFIDEILIRRNDNYFFGLITAMFFAMLLKGAISFYRGILLQRMQNKLILISSYKYLIHFFNLPINFFAQRYAGDLSNRVENNNNLSIFLTGDVSENVLNLFVTIFYLTLLLIYSPILTAVGVSIALFSIVIMKIGSASMGDTTLKYQQDQGKMLGSLLAGISASDSIKASGIENEFAGRIQGYYAKTIETEQKLGKKQEILDALQDITEQITTIVVLIIGGCLIIKGKMTEGTLVAFNSLLVSFIEPLSELSSFVTKIQTARADSRRVEDILRYEEGYHIKNREQLDDIGTKLNGNVILEKVSFGYSILESPLVHDFGFNINSGQSIAFVGPSGSGKTTVAKLCSGLYQPWEGKVLLDGHPIYKILPEVLSCSLSIVNQETVLFSGTVRDNLTMWNNNITEVDMLKAAKDACIHDVIMGRRGAYDSIVLENGANFSGGQKQRLEIARALATNPSILILDEATSALDPLVEEEIMKNIKKRGCTCIISAHRLSTIKDCDEIIVMEHGKIVQRGNHDSLMKQIGLYRDLIQVQA